MCIYHLVSLFPLKKKWPGDRDLLSWALAGAGGAGAAVAIAAGTVGDGSDGDGDGIGIGCHSSFLL